jgi:REP element-mobilizing transposase RayT
MDMDFYKPGSVQPAYALRWTWTGWPSNGSFPEIDDSVFNETKLRWENDGIRLLEHRLASDQWQLTVSTKPSIAPATIVGRLKGRLDHAMRHGGRAIKFSRKVALRSLGNNSEHDVRRYVEAQVDSAGFVDPEFAIQLKQFSRTWNNQESSDPISVDSGKYWYQLHIVLVTETRYRFRNLQAIAEIFESVQSIAQERRFSLGSLSVMPDHVHIQTRGACKDSPEETVLAFQNGVARQLRMASLWMPTYYVGTIGAYNMNAIRR